MIDMYASDIGALCAERKWTRSRLILELRQAARTRNEPLPSDESLRRMIREWTNGRRGLSEFYAELVSIAFGVRFVPGKQDTHAAATDWKHDENANPGAELAQRLHAGTTVDSSLVELLEGQTQSLRLLDRRLGAAKLLAQAEAHVDQTVDLLKYTLPGGQRAALGATAAEAAALAGWQALDLGDPTKSWTLHETAKAAARESEDPVFLSHVTAQQAYALLDTERVDDALSLVQHARTTAGTRVPALLQSWLWAAEAEALAACGEAKATQAALEAASRLLPADPVTEELPFLALDSVHLARWRGHCLARLGLDQAVDELATAVAAMDASFTRAAAGLHCDLALAYSVRGEHRAAREQAQQAATLAAAASSARQRKRIAGLLSSGA